MSDFLIAVIIVVVVLALAGVGYVGDKVVAVKNDITNSIDDNKRKLKDFKDETILTTKRIRYYFPAINKTLSYDGNKPSDNKKEK